jgi:S-adenosylmethionine hydrolase
MDRPIISFLTDFGSDLAPAICRGVMLSIARDAQIVDISHGVRKFAILEGAYLLWAAVPWLPVAIHVAVVDPGVGTDRLPIGVRNGLLMPAAAALGGAAEARAIENPELRLADPGSTFHGRDIFAPAAAHLATGRRFQELGREVPVDALVALEFPRPEIDGETLVATVAWVDSFGNVRLFATGSDLERALGSSDQGRRIVLEASATDGTVRPSATGTWARTFGNLAPGELLVYTDSSGLLAVAENQGSAAGRNGIGVGDTVRMAGEKPREHAGPSRMPRPADPRAG